MVVFLGENSNLGNELNDNKMTQFYSFMNYG